MKFVEIEGEIGPVAMYKPYIYGNVVECSNHFTIFCPHGEVKVIKKDKEYGKEPEIHMRDPKRIEPFLQDLGVIWKNCCPDWRFGQLVENVFGEMDYIPFMLEEPRMIEEICKYFKINTNPEFRNKLNIYKKDNKRKNKKTCLHCGENVPDYCEDCYQKLIAENMKLQLEIKRLRGEL